MAKHEKKSDLPEVAFIGFDSCGNGVNSTVPKVRVWHILRIPAFQLRAGGEITADAASAQSDAC